MNGAPHPRSNHGTGHAGPRDGRRPVLFPIIWALLALAAGNAYALAQASPLEKDLGDGLVYFRVRQAPADLPTAEAVRKRPAVLDLRFATAEKTSAVVFGAWLKFHASVRAPIFVLVNGATAQPLLEPLRARDAMAGVLTIGVAGQPLPPDIAVAQSSADERKAYDALEQGSSITALTVDHPTKRRNDEASLSREPATERQRTADADATQKDDESSVPIDAALQRALHLHRALRAMKKL